VTESNVKISASKKDRGPYHPSESRTFDLLHTRLEVSFDWQKRHLKGIATLDLKPYFYPQDSILLDAKGFDIHAVDIIIGKVRKSAVYNYNSRILSIRPEHKIYRGDTVRLVIEYTAKPEEMPVGGSSAINSDKGLYFINADGTDTTKPRQIWTQGETEASSKWFPTIDAPNERCTQEMYITVDSTYNVVSNGEFQYSTENGDGTRTHYWKMDKPHAPYLFMMAIGKYAVVEDKWRDVELAYLVEPAYKPYAMKVFGNTPEMIEFFSSKLRYPYPWNKYYQVVVRDYVSGAMENTTATIFMEGLQIDSRERLDVNWDYIIAHELFHHWFGDLVTCESWSNLPLNESFANYSEYLWAEYKYGVDEADLHGENEFEEYLEESQTKKEPMIRFHYLDKEDMFDRHSYNKGGRILHMLRKYTGDSAFFEALNLYLKKNQFTSVEIHNLRLAFEEVTGEDLNWFFDQWFFKPGHPELKIEHRYENNDLILKINQVQDTLEAPVYRIPVNIVYSVQGQKITESLIIKGKEQEFRFKLSQKPEYVIFDSDHSIVSVKNHNRSKDELINQYLKSKTYLDKKEAIYGLLPPDSIFYNQKVGLQDQEIREVLLETLSENFWGLRNLSLEYLTQYQLTDPDYFLDKVRGMAESDEKPKVRANAILFLSRYYNQQYKDIYLKGLKDSSYAVSAAALSAWFRSEDSSKVDLQEFEKLNNLEIMLALANRYVVKKYSGKYTWFKEKMQNIKGNPRALYNMLFFYGEYVLRTGTPEQKLETMVFMDEIYNTAKYDVIKQTAQKYIEKLK
jgi:aminopeptidase N